MLFQDLKHQIEESQVTKLNTFLEYFILLPLGLEPKLNRKWWQIHHLSYTLVRSVNCNIPDDFGSFEYTSVDKAIVALLKIGKNATLIKRDLSDAFHHISVLSTDWWLLGFN